MLSVVRCTRPLQHPSLFSAFLGNQINRNPASFCRLNSKDTNQQDSKDSNSKSADTMSSLGEGYATRSDEEGFGGIHGGNQSNSKGNNKTEFDESQGSEVKEKEKGRNQS